MTDADLRRLRKHELLAIGRAARAYLAADAELRRRGREGQPCHEAFGAFLRAEIHLRSLLPE